MASLEASLLRPHDDGERVSGGSVINASVSVDSCIPASISPRTNCAGKITAVFDDVTISSNFDSGKVMS